MSLEDGICNFHRTGDAAVEVLNRAFGDPCFMSEFMNVGDGLVNICDCHGASD